jgi:hypothetical protein
MNSIDVSASAGVSRSSDSTRRFRSLSGLSDRELLSRVKDLVSRERAVTIEVLVHLIEVERRRLHVGLGYASMFDYCTRHLRYSSSAAARRIHTARCIRDYPEVHGLLEKNEVNLSTVSMVSSILTRENYEDILKRVRNKSQKEVEGIVADYRPPVMLRDRARPVSVTVPATAGPAGRDAAGLPLGGTMHSSSAVGPDQSAAAVARSLDGPSESSAPGRPMGASVAGVPSSTGREALSAQRTSMSEHSRCGSAKKPNSDEGAPRIERKFHVQFLASERFMKKLEKAKALLSNKTSSLSYEFVFEAALDEFLKDHDPEERNKRRETRRENAKAGCGQVDGPLFRRRAGGPPASRVRTKGEQSRRIPAAARDAVFARDKGRCVYVGPNGKRCDAVHNLQIDHVIPHARGGTNTIDNLRLLCERHNKLEAERIYGANVMKRFRARE